MKGKYLINNLKEKDKGEGITLVCCFSRKLFVPIFFSALKNMKLPRKDMHLLVYDNTEDTPLADALLDVINPIIKDYKSVRLYKSYLKGKGNILGSGNEQFKRSKLFNIWSMWKKVYHMIYTPTFFQLEDDTIAPPHAFEKLYAVFQDKNDVGLVTGISTGRHAYPWTPVRLGVHYIKMKNFKVMQRISLKPNCKGLKEIDASGVYCFVADTKAFMTGFNGYDPVAFKTPFFALDNVLTWNIKEHGYRIFADFDVWVTHLQASSARIIAFGKEQALQMADIWIPEFNNYAQAVEIKRKNQRFRKTRVFKPAPSWEI